MRSRKARGDKETHAMNIARALRQLRRSVGLESAGLSESVIPAIGILAFGMLAGAGVALLFAPMTGKKLREEMENKLSDYRSRLMLQQGTDHLAEQHPIVRNNVKPAEPFPRS
jgi:hypothetical protein